MNIGAIVEGHGEVDSVPLLVRRVATERSLRYPQVLPPWRIPRSKLVKSGELEKAVELIARRVGEGGGILILIDAYDDCPAGLGPELLERARAHRPDRAIEVVLANREYEAWFLAAAVSLRGSGGLPADLEPPPDPEAVRDAKRWLGDRMPNGYSPPVDQPKLTATFSLDEARTARSYCKLERAVAAMLGPSS